MDAPEAVSYVWMNKTRIWALRNTISPLSRFLEEVPYKFLNDEFLKEFHDWQLLDLPSQKSQQKLTGFTKYLIHTNDLYSVSTNTWSEIISNTQTDARKKEAQNSRLEKTSATRKLKRLFKNSNTSLRIPHKNASLCAHACNSQIFKTSNVPLGSQAQGTSFFTSAG